MHAIRTFTFRGKEFDYDGAGYEIDRRHRVYRNGKQIAENGGMVTLCFKNTMTRFGKIRLFRAVVHALPAHIEANSGIRVVRRDLPTDDVDRYAWETPEDRDALIRRRQDALDAADEMWKPVEHNGEIFRNYEISKKTGIVRNASTERELVTTKTGVKDGLTTATKGQRALCRDDGSRVGILVYRVYMSTFHADERHDDQTDVDHINGDRFDHRPCNLRWASSSENMQYKFKEIVKRKKCPRFNGDETQLKRFENTRWFFGIYDGDYAVVDARKNVRRVGDFVLRPYPVIKIDNKMFLVHRVVAYVENLISKEQFYARENSQVVMHINADKADFRPGNLRAGTSAQNNVDRQNNPKTTQRKRVRQLDDDGVCLGEYESILAASKVLAQGNSGGVSSAIRTKGTYKNFRWEFTV